MFYNGTSHYFKFFSREPWNHYTLLYHYFKKDIANIYKFNGNSNDVTDIYLGQAFSNSTYTYLFVQNKVC